MPSNPTLTTGQNSGPEHPSPPYKRPCVRLIRKKFLLEKLALSKSTLHAKLDRRSRYYDASMPRPFYLHGSRIPLWDEAAVDAWLVNLASGEGGAE